uniref:Uncharacterized protein n=1 Tax=Lygus hesperus TaxID=30085 RepID=A0A146L9R8_LYGHE
MEFHATKPSHISATPPTKLQYKHSVPVRLKSSAVGVRNSVQKDAVAGDSANIAAPPDSTTNNSNGMRNTVRHVRLLDTGRFVKQDRRGSSNDAGGTLKYQESQPSSKDSSMSPHYPCDVLVNVPI